MPGALPGGLGIPWGPSLGARGGAAGLEGDSLDCWGLLVFVGGARVGTALRCRRGVPDAWRASAPYGAPVADMMAWPFFTGNDLGDGSIGARAFIWYHYKESRATC